MAPSTTAQIFQILPHDLLFDEIFCYMNSLELIFTLRNVSHQWRELSDEYLCDCYKETIIKIAPKEVKKVFHFSELLNSKQGRKFVKYLMRKQAYEFACKLIKIAESNDTKIVNLEAKWVDEELSVLKGYFSRFTDLQEIDNSNLPKPKPTASNTSTASSSKGFFGNAMSFIGSFFSNNPSYSSSTTTTITTATATVTATSSQQQSNQQNAQYDHLTKIILDGDCGSGKTSLLNCAMNDTPVHANSPYMPTIGVDFAMKTFHFGETTRVKLQLWDQSGPERFRTLTMSYYRNASCIFFLIDPYSIYTNDVIKCRLESIKRHAPCAEVVVITTKKDLHSNKSKIIYSNEQADEFAFENFGGIHLDITNTQLEEPKTIALYGCLLKYLLSPQNL